MQIILSDLTYLIYIKNVLNNLLKEIVKKKYI